MGLLYLALRLRCPHCASGPVFDRARQRTNCPECGYRFERESGYFLGAMVVSNAVIGVVALIVMLVLIFTGRSPLVAVGLPILTALVAMPLFLPFSRTIWMALDLRFDPPNDDDFGNAGAGTSRPAGSG
ncbi:MAG: IS1 family transposase [Acidimicrobiales bacterium]|nr:IS1 family transposase [Acidimicrobiales bacterium]